jgi:hypothetical protein
LFLVAWAALSVPPGVIANGNFGTGNMSSWTTLGSASAVGTQGNIVPTDGNIYQAQIASGKDSTSTTCGALAGGTNNFTDVTVATLNSALNLAPNAFANTLPAAFSASPPMCGSAIYQTFTALAGNAVSFDWSFATDEKVPTPHDAAFYTLLQPGSSQAQLVELTDTDTGTFHAGTTGSPFVNVTNYSHVSITLPSTGTYTIGFVSLQAYDDSIASATYISSVQGGSVLPTTPAPATWSLGLLGLGFIAIYSGVRRLLRAN